MNDQIVDADITPVSTDERTLASQHVEALKGIIRMEDSLFIFDRGYTPKHSSVRSSAQVRIS